MDTLYIVIPAYNESENIKRTIEEWCPVVEKHNGGGASRLVIINDGSRDDTVKVAKNWGVNFSRVRNPPVAHRADEAKRRPRFHRSVRLPLCT